MKILLTGSTGFLGKAVSDMLNKAGYQVWNVVRATRNLENEILADISQPFADKLPACDIIVHLAANVYFGKEIIPGHFETNTISTLRLAELAREKNCYFIFASMAGMHGAKRNVVGVDTPIELENSYALSKYISEEIIRTFVNNFSILRIAGIYGLDGPSHLGLNTSISSAYHYQTCPVMQGSGSGRRNYICVSDTAKWILSLVREFESKGSDKKELLYLAGPEILSIAEYLQGIVDILIPGDDIEKREGPETADLIVNSFPAPFEQITFRNYLLSLRPLNQ